MIVRTSLPIEKERYWKERNAVYGRSLLLGLSANEMNMAVTQVGKSTNA